VRFALRLENRDLTGLCILIWCSGEDVVSDLLLVAGVVALFACTACAVIGAVAAIASVGLGVYQAARGGPEDAALSVIGGLTFGIGAPAARLTRGVQEISRASRIVSPGDGLKPREWSRFNNHVNRPIQRAGQVWGGYEVAQGGSSAYERTKAAVTRNASKGGGRLWRAV